MSPYRRGASKVMGFQEPWGLFQCLQEVPLSSQGMPSCFAHASLDSPASLRPHLSQGIVWVGEGLWLLSEGVEEAERKESQRGRGVASFAYPVDPGSLCFQLVSFPPSSLRLTPPQLWGALASTLFVLRF